MNPFHWPMLVWRWLSHVADWFSHPLYEIESGLVVLALVLALIAPRLGQNFFARVEAVAGRFARRKGLAILTVGLLAFFGRLALQLFLPIPSPLYHDEFSYILLGKTLASGRLTNPTHPMWQHFESFHILQKPTNTSFYPVAQGVLLALGQSLAHLPILGIWIAGGLMAAALCWMLQGWLPPGWALLGSLLAIIRLIYLTYWTNSYWGGLHGALGGALVLGALPRLWRTQRVRDAVLFAIGVGILANSRPYEGLALTAVAGVALLWRLWRLRQPRAALRALAPMAAVLAVVGAGMMFYFHAVTGSAFKLPYTAGLHQYGFAPLFIVQPPFPEPHYRHATMRRFYENYEIIAYRQMRTPRGFFDRSLARLNLFVTFYLGPALLLPFLLIPWCWRDRRMRFLIVTLVGLALALAIEVWFFPHYFGPGTAALWALLIQSMRHIRQWRWRSRPAGLFLVRSLAAICFVMFGIQVGALAAGHHFHRELWCCTEAGYDSRADVEKIFQSMPGKHLVIVRYSPTHDVHHEWVYNDPDIDHAPIVWAREMSPEEDAELRRYFHDRRVWLLKPDAKPPKLVPYPSDEKSGS